MDSMGLSAGIRTIPAAEIVVDVEEVQMLGTFNGFVRQNTETPQVYGFSKDFYQKIEVGLEDFPHGVKRHQTSRRLSCVR